MTTASPPGRSAARPTPVALLDALSQYGVRPGSLVLGVSGTESTLEALERNGYEVALVGTEHDQVPHDGDALVITPSSTDGSVTTAAAQLVPRGLVLVVGVLHGAEADEVRRLGRLGCAGAEVARRTGVPRARGRASVLRRSGRTDGVVVARGAGYGDPLPVAVTASRKARLTLPGPASRLLGSLKVLPALARDAGARREVREERHIEARGRGDVAPAGFSERVIEVPWVLEQLGDHPGHVLDVGTANAPLAYQRQLLRTPWSTLDVVDIVEGPLPAARLHRADLRALPFRDGRFDVAVCISTIEHVGLDNERYGTTGAFDAEGERGDATALRELGRVTAAGGRVLLTLPAGRPGDYGWYRLYDETEARRLAQHASLDIVEMHARRYSTDRGWLPAPPAEVSGLGYADEGPAASAVLLLVLRPSRDDS